MGTWTRESEAQSKAWVIIAARGLPLAADSGGYSPVCFRSGNVWALFPPTQQTPYQPPEEKKWYKKIKPYTALGFSLWAILHTRAGR